MEKEAIVLNLETDGECLTFYGDADAPGVEFECVLAPGSKGPEPHIHTLQTETFHVVSGVMIDRVKGQDEVTLGPGKESSYHSRRYTLSQTAVPKNPW